MALRFPARNGVAMKLFIFENVYPVRYGIAHAAIVAESKEEARSQLFDTLLAHRQPPLDPDVQPDEEIEVPCLTFIEFHE